MENKSPKNTQSGPPFVIWLVDIWSPGGTDPVPFLTITLNPIPLIQSRCSSFKAATMHIAFLTNPASGQVNVQLATAQQLVSQNYRITFLSADSCGKKIDRFRLDQEEHHRDLISFIGLGSGHTVDDLYVRCCSLSCSVAASCWTRLIFW